jgi:hypothetical protein
MYKVLVFLVTLLLFAAFVVLTLPLEACRWADRHLAGHPSAP